MKKSLRDQNLRLVLRHTRHREFWGTKKCFECLAHVTGEPVWKLSVFETSVEIIVTGTYFVCDNCFPKTKIGKLYAEAIEKFPNETPTVEDFYRYAGDAYLISVIATGFLGLSALIYFLNTGG